MRIPTLPLLSSETAEDRITLAAPRVGVFECYAEAGQVLSPGMAVGTLAVLNRRYRLIVPEGLGGRVAQIATPRGRSGVGYGTAILELQIGTLSDASLPPALSADAAMADLPEGAEVFRAPIEGQFYRRPSPDAPAFVEVDAQIQPGDTIGLIEVMKFFHPVVYDGTSPRRVERFLADDGQPVDGGAALAVLVP